MIPNLTTDDRAVSEVVGSILVFGLLITLLAVMQTQAIPMANEGVEANHNQEVQSDLIKFKEAASRTAARGTTESTRIRMGTTYPSRLLFFNPRQPSGEIRTVDQGSVSIDNVEATDTTIQKYIDGDITGLETRRLEYEPNYNEFQNAPVTVMEYGALYNDFGDQQTVENPGDIVNGNTIDLTFYAGDLARSSSTAMSLDARPASAPARTVSIQPKNSGDNVTIVLPTNLPAEVWNESLAEEPNVIEVVETGQDEVEIRLDGTRGLYDLRMAKIGVGSGVERPDATYIMGLDGGSTTITTGSPGPVTFEVRDKYNNPVRNQDVYATLDNDAEGTLRNNRVTTDAEGQATVLYDAQGVSPGTTEQVHASFERDIRGANLGGFNAETNLEDVSVTVTVTDRFGARGAEPEASIDSVSDESRAGFLGLFGDTARFEIEWSAEIVDPDYTLESAEVEMKHTDTGRIVDRITYDLSNDQESDTVVLEDLRENTGTCGNEYEIRVVVTTTGGQIDSDSTVETANC